MHRLSFLLGLVFCSSVTIAQVTDAFDDDDFTSGTVWSGVSSVGSTANAFEIAESDKQLKSQALSGGSGTRINYLSTAESSQVDLSGFNASWSFRMRNAFTVSSSLGSSNQSRVYLMSDVADLSGDVNGYYILLRMTSSGEELTLNRQSGSSTTEVALSGTMQSITSEAFVSVTVTRSNTGEWEVFVNGNTQGTATDVTHTTTDYFGVQVRYSANSRSGLFYFDDFATSYTTVADTDAPTLTASSANSTTEVLIDFNENVDQTTAENTSNYSFNNGITVSNATRNTTDNSQVTLTVSALTSGTTYTVTVNNVEDESSNAIANNSETSFEYIEFSNAGFRDVVINELLVDQSPAVGLPEAEFIELFNPTNKFFDLENWAISDDNSPGTSEKFGAFTLRPNSYVIICDDANESLFTGFGDVIAVTSLGALTNSGDDVVLSNASGSTIDNLTYTSAPTDGVTYEQINPELPCSGEFNFAASTNSDGGTPGAQNSVFDNSADTTAPTVSSLNVVDTDSIQITFSEPLASGTVNTSSFGLSGFTISAVSFSSDQVVDILLTTSLVSETSYTLTYSSITDCSGNALSDASTTFYYDITAPVLDRLVVATDNAFFLIFNEPLNESDAENESNYLLDQSFGAPASAILQDSATNRVLVAFDSDFAKGTNYTLTYDALEDTTGNALSSTAKAFTFQDQIDTVFAVSSNILQITYTATPSNSSATMTRNYLLEDVGNPTDVLAGGNDRTFRLVFDAAMDDNSDLLLYVENVQTSDAADTLITPAYTFRYDTDSPSLESITVMSSTQLRLIFDEILESNSATNLNNYELEDDEKPVTATLNEDTVTLTFANTFETEQEKTLTYTQIEDLYGNTFTSNRTADFTYDPLAPRVDSIYQANETTIIIRATEQLSVTSLNAGNFSTAAQNAASFALKGPDSLELELTFASALTESADLDFNIAAWQDLAGNSLSNAIDTILNTRDPRIATVQFKTDSTVQITFSKSMMSGAYELGNYSLEGLTIESVSDVGNNTAEIEISGNFSETTYLLSVSNASSESGNSLQFDSLDLTFDTYLSSVSILDSLTIDLQFETEFSSFDKTNIEVNGTNPNLVSIDPDDASRVQLLLTTALQENSEVSLYWKSTSDRFGRNLPDHTTTINYDLQSPSLTEVESLLENTVQIIFDESISSQSAGSVVQYSIVDLGEAQSLEFVNDTTVQLTFTALDSGTMYQLVVTDIADSNNNFTTTDTLSFTYAPPEIISEGLVVFSEIMADPGPVVGLPEAEYIEVLNTSNRTLDLASLRLSNDTDTIRISSYELASGASVALIDEGDEELFAEYNVLAVDGLFSLDNAGELLVLSNINDEIVDSLTYSSDWFGETDKADGGYSLELIEALSACSNERNWSGSDNSLGGTPGTANSLEPETNAPTVNAGTLMDNTIAISFNEEMNETSFSSMAFSISNGLTVASFTSASASVELEFEGSPTEGQFFDLSLSGLSDCRGNAMADTTLTFVISSEPQTGDLIINEIMADPSPVVGLPEVEYIEIFNASDSIIDLQGLVLTKANAETNLSTYFLDSKAYVALVDENDLELMSEFNVLGVADLISFSNDEDSIVLKNAEDQIIDRVQYEDAWYGDPGRDDGGYSLELIDLESNCSIPNNWGASTSETGGTPGAANAITVETEIPTIVESIFSDGQLTLQFSEEMLTASILNYTSSQADLINESNYDEALQQLQLTFNETTASLQQIDLTVSGIADCSGNVMEDSTFVFLQAVAPTFNDIIITEIMSDPDPEVGLPNREYLEIYNRSENILDLNEMVIQDGSGTSAPIGGVILPGDYQILVSTSGISDFSDSNVNGVGSFPGLSNSGEQLSLLYNDELIFQVSYLVEWHDSDKSEGGYSLEMRDINNPCGTSSNWGSAMAEAGGTPGEENSIRQDIPDNFGPNLTRAVAITADSILIEFDEALIPTLKPVIRISEGIEITETIISGEDLARVSLSLNEPLVRGVVYTVTAVLVQDCLGNPVRENTTELVLPFEAESSQILLSEIMFNPLDDGVDFVEVYNTTDQFISLKDWSFGNESQDRVITEDDLIIAPESYFAFTEDVARLRLDFPDAPIDNLIEVDDLPTYSNDFGDVYLIDGSGRDQDSLFYDADFHSDLLRSVDGVSLERISFDSPNGSDNWNSAASTVNFGTPGAPNSQSLDLSAFNDPVEAEPRVFVPGSGTNSFTTINYEFETSGNFANITLFDQNGRFVKELARGISLGSDGFIRWDGTGADGGVVRVGYYVVVFEVFNSNGQSEVIKETVVVGRDF